MMVVGAGGVIRSISGEGGLGSRGVSRSLSGMYLVCVTGLSGKVTALSPEASETKSTAVSLSKCGGGPEWTEFNA